MAIREYEDVRTGVVKFLAAAVGDQLSELGTTGRPSILKDRTKGPRPHYPYMVVDHITADKEHDEGWLLNAVTGPSGRTVYTNEQRVRCKVYCYDSGKRAHHILNLVRSYTVDETVRQILNNLAGATYQHTSGSIDAPIFVDTAYIDGAYVFIDLLVRQEFEIPVALDPYSSTIETINMLGDYDEGRISYPLTVEMPKDGHVVSVTVIDPGKGYKMGGAYDTEATDGVGLMVEATSLGASGELLTLIIRYGGEGYIGSEDPSLVLTVDTQGSTLNVDNVENFLEDLEGPSQQTTYATVLGGSPNAILEVTVTRDIPF